MQAPIKIKTTKTQRPSQNQPPAQASASVGNTQAAPDPAASTTTTTTTQTNTSAQDKKEKKEWWFFAKKENEKSPFQIVALFIGLCCALTFLPNSLLNEYLIFKPSTQFGVGLFGAVCTYLGIGGKSYMGSLLLVVLVVLLFYVGYTTHTNRSLFEDIKGFKNNSFFSGLLSYGQEKTTKQPITKTFTGIGFTGGVDGQGGIHVLFTNIDVKYGQTVKVEGAETNYNWTYQKLASFVNRAEENGGIAMRAPEGAKFTVTVY